MDYRILGETLPAVEVRLQTGEAMYTPVSYTHLDVYKRQVVAALE